MLHITQEYSGDRLPDAHLVLPFDCRQKSRLRATCADGRIAAVILPRGTILRHGDLLWADCGVVVEVVAAPETVSTAVSTNPLTLTRAAYHLGNRHVALQITAQWLRYLHDPVLDRMVTELGLEVHAERAPFEPETGAYRSHPQFTVLAHSHSHSHSHPHSHSHSHEEP